MCTKKYFTFDKANYRQKFAIINSMFIKLPNEWNDHCLFLFCLQIFWVILSEWGALTLTTFPLPIQCTLLCFVSHTLSLSWPGLSYCFITLHCNMSVLVINWQTRNQNNEDIFKALSAATWTLCNQPLASELQRRSSKILPGQCPVYNRFFS